MFDSKEVKKYLDKIENSQEFHRSSVYKKLLLYLTEAALKGESPKEFSIGHDVFKHSADDIGTSTVRVYVLKLRKRLEKYYNGEGKNDKLCFVIPKGRYTIEFVSQINKSDLNKKNRKLFVLSLSAIALSILAFLLFISSHTNNSSKLRKTKFWSELIDSKKETIIIIGDFFIYQDMVAERENESVINIRNIHINSKKQLEDYIISNNKNFEDFRPLETVSYLQRNSVYCLQLLFPLLYENDIKYKIIVSSDFNWDTYINYNMIYIGSYKNLKKLELVFDKLNFKINNSIIYNNEPENKITYASYYDFNELNSLDYTIISKIAGSNNNLIYLFSSDLDVGCIESIKQFTDYEFLKNFEKTVNKANYFKAVNESKGIHQLGVSSKMVYFKTLEDSSLNNLWH